MFLLFLPPGHSGVRGGDVPLAAWRARVQHQDGGVDGNPERRSP